MKKVSFIGIVVLLLCMIICLIGYNSLTIKQEREKYKETSQYNQEPEKKVESSKNSPTIYCLGDSLSSYPTALSALTGLSVNKLGGSTDQTIDIAIKIGRIKIYTNDITIPASTDSVDLTLYDEDENELDVLKGELDNFSSVTIAGVEGTLSYNSEKDTHTFKRDEAGDEVSISSPTEITAEIPEFEDNKIAIIFTGTYDPNIENGIFRTITYQRAIINQLDTDKYIVVSLTDKNRFPIVRDMNSVLAEEHGEHFLDFRSYLLSDGLNDANITPTEEDTEAIDNGYIPPSFLKDETHGNGKFNDLLAEQLLEKMIDLGYLTQDQLNN